MDEVKMRLTGAERFDDLEYQLYEEMLAMDPDSDEYRSLVESMGKLSHASAEELKALADWTRAKAEEAKVRVEESKVKVEKAEIAAGLAKTFMGGATALGLGYMTMHFEKVGIITSKAWGFVSKVLPRIV